MGDPVWLVRLHNGSDAQVVAETWWTDHGDLLFGRIEHVTEHGVITVRNRPAQGYAAGEWKRVQAYA